MHINRVILMGQVTDAVAPSDAYAVFGLRVGDAKFPVYVFDPLARRELLATLRVGATVQVDGCLAFDPEVDDGRLYVAVTADRACQVRLADRSVFAAGGPPSLSTAKSAGPGSDAAPSPEPGTGGPTVSREAPPTAASPHGRHANGAANGFAAPVARAADGTPPGTAAADAPAKGGAAPAPAGQPIPAETPTTRAAAAAPRQERAATPAATPAGTQPRPGRPRMGGIAGLPPATAVDSPAAETDAASEDEEDPIPF